MSYFTSSREWPWYGSMDEHTFSLVLLPKASPDSSVRMHEVNGAGFAEVSLDKDGRIVSVYCRRHPVEPPPTRWQRLLARLRR